MKRFTVKVNKVKNINERRRYANNLIKEINHRLHNGLNPLLMKQAGNALKRLPAKEDELNESIKVLINIIDSQNDVLDEKSQMTVEDAFNSIDNILERELTNKSLRNYRTAMRAMLKFLEANNMKGLPIRAFDKKLATNFLYDYGDKRQLSNNGINALKVKSSALMTRLVDEKIILVNPFFGIKKLKEQQYNINLWDLDDLKKYLDYCSTNEPHLYLASLLVLQVYIRPVELCRIIREDIIIDKGLLMVRVKKGIKYKREPGSMSAELIRTLKSIRETMHQGEFLFGKYGGVGSEPINGDHFNRTFKIVKEKLNFKKPSVKFYDLKHTGVTIMVENNVPLQKIQKQCRHDSISTTEKYVGRLRKKADHDFINFPSVGDILNNS